MDSGQGHDPVRRSEATTNAGQSHAIRAGAGSQTAVHEEAATATSVDSDPKGVVRLLEAGHFKGVAAVRLSINFHAELSARRSSAAAAEIDSAASNLVEEVSEVLSDSSTVAGEGDESTTAMASETFSNAMGEIVLGFRGGELDAGAALAAFQMTFDDLLTSLNVTPATEDESPAEEEALVEVMSEAMDAVDSESGDAVVVAEEVEAAAPIESESVTTSTLTGGSLMEELGQLFGEFMADVQSAVDAMTAVREFAQPNGNGAAFEKFVAMYREMTAPVDAGIEADPSAMGESGTVDQLA